MLRTRSFFLAIGLILFPMNAFGATIAVSFTGTITDTGGMPGAPFSIGDSVVGSLSYDTVGAVDTDPDPSFGHYGLGNLLSFSITLNGVYTATADLTPGPDFGNYIWVNDDHGGTSDRFSVRADASGAAIGGSDLNTIQISMQSFDERISGDALPAADEINSFLPTEAHPNVNWASFCCAYYQVKWQIDSISAVPEPGAALLLASVLLGIRARRIH